MTDFTIPEERRMILEAISNGDVKALKSLFEECNIGLVHPTCQGEYYDRTIPDAVQLPTVETMTFYACASQRLDILRFLCEKYPDEGFAYSGIRVAIDSGNAELVKFLCERDPSVVNAELGDDCPVQVLGYAAQKGKDEIVKILLEAGADPNEPPSFRVNYWPFSAAIMGGLSTSTIELYYDKGYNGYESGAASMAVRQSRPDILEVMFRRGRHLPWAQFSEEKSLIDAANERKNPEMITLIRRLYADHNKRRKGRISRMFSKFRSRS
ncbi:hypothetical protein DM02DRAFT_676366 [Periconia macrospinosa]|uniref:Uncharacterized protein n=1 Tax=Periconia macrospinosa TaxID=97972 RepID=A0A2V1D811_9PLEO|nr:hypothetical protein DM02DRAFT_676366 [Periconia macrospinosa]